MKSRTIKASLMWILDSLDNAPARQRDHGIIVGSDRRRLQPFGPISWFSFRVSECDDPKFIGHVDVVNDKWKTAHDVTSCAALSCRPAFRCGDDGLQCLSRCGFEI